MSNYTTGEIAKLCDVTVRTVQYYDSRGILTPSGISEGGRRLYFEKDIKKLKLINLLRSIDLSIDTISKVFEDINSKEIINLLLEDHKKMLNEELLNEELLETETKLEKVNEILKHFKSETFFLKNLF